MNKSRSFDITLDAPLIIFWTFSECFILNAVKIFWILYLGHRIPDVSSLFLAVSICTAVDSA